MNPWKIELWLRPIDHAHMAINPDLYAIGLALQELGAVTVDDSFELVANGRPPSGESFLVHQASAYRVGSRVIVADAYSPEPFTKAGLYPFFLWRRIEYYCRSMDNLAPTDVLMIHAPGRERGEKIEAMGFVKAGACLYERLPQLQQQRVYKFTPNGLELLRATASAVAPRRAVTFRGLEVPLIDHTWARYSPAGGEDSPPGGEILRLA